MSEGEGEVMEAFEGVADMIIDVIMSLIMAEVEEDETRIVAEEGVEVALVVAGITMGVVKTKSTSDRVEAVVPLLRGKMGTGGTMTQNKALWDAPQ